MAVPAHALHPSSVTSSRALSISPGSSPPPSTTFLSTSAPHHHHHNSLDEEPFSSGKFEEKVKSYLDTLILSQSFQSNQLMYLDPRANALWGSLRNVRAQSHRLGMGMGATSEDGKGYPSAYNSSSSSSSVSGTSTSKGVHIYPQHRHKHHHSKRRETMPEPSPQSPEKEKDKDKDVDNTSGSMSSYTSYNSGGSEVGQFASSSPKAIQVKSPLFARKRGSSNSSGTASSLSDSPSKKEKDKDKGWYLITNKTFNLELLGLEAELGTVCTFSIRIYYFLSIYLSILLPSYLPTCNISFCFLTDEKLLCRSSLLSSWTNYHLRYVPKQ